MDVGLIVTLSIVGVVFGIVLLRLLIGRICRTRCCLQSAIRESKVSYNPTPLWCTSLFCENRVHVFNTPGFVKANLYRFNELKQVDALEVLINLAREEANKKPMAAFPGVVKAAIEAANYQHPHSKATGLTLLDMLDIQTPEVIEIAREAAEFDDDDIIRDLGRAILAKVTKSATLPNHKQPLLGPEGV